MTPMVPKVNMRRQRRQDMRGSTVRRFPQETRETEAPEVSPLYKTRLCNFFIQGCCKEGAQCTFAHGEDDLRASPDFERTSVCPSMLRDGRCDRPDCRYAHTKEELRADGRVLKTRFCSFFLNGGCVVGEACRFAHSISELQEAESLDAQRKDMKMGKIMMREQRRAAFAAGKFSAASAMNQQQQLPPARTNTMPAQMVSVVPMMDGQCQWVQGLILAAPPAAQAAPAVGTAGMPQPIPVPGLCGSPLAARTSPSLPVSEKGQGLLLSSPPLATASDDSPDHFDMRTAPVPGLCGSPLATTSPPQPVSEKGQGLSLSSPPLATASDDSPDHFEMRTARVPGPCGSPVATTSPSLPVSEKGQGLLLSSPPSATASDDSPDHFDMSTLHVAPVPGPCGSPLATTPPPQPVSEESQGLPPLSTASDDSPDHFDMSTPHPAPVPGPCGPPLATTSPPQPVSEKVLLSSPPLATASPDRCEMSTPHPAPVVKIRPDMDIEDTMILFSSCPKLEKSESSPLVPRRQQCKKSLTDVTKQGTVKVGDTGAMDAAGSTCRSCPAKKAGAAPGSRKCDTFECPTPFADCSLCHRSDGCPVRPCAACTCGLKVLTENTFLTLREDVPKEPMQRSKSV